MLCKAPSPFIKELAHKQLEAGGIDGAFPVKPDHSVESGVNTPD